MTSFQIVAAAALATCFTGLIAWRLRHRISQWRRNRWLKEAPRTGAFYASTPKLALRLTISLTLFAAALALLSQAVPWLANSNLFFAVLVALFAAIPAYMGFTHWAGPGKLAARHLRLFAGKPVLRLDTTGLSYLSFGPIPWTEVSQIQYIARVAAQRGVGPVLAVRVADTRESLLVGDPVDVWAYHRFAQEVTRWIEADTGQWLILDLSCLAGASTERVGHWMAALQYRAQHGVAPVVQPEHGR